MANEVTEPKSKSLMAAQQDYINSIAKGLHSLLGEVDTYQAICGYNILSQINVVLAKEGLNYKSPNVDRETINNAIKFVMVYRLNYDNREVFVIVRNEKRGKIEKVNDKGQKYEVDNWMKVNEVKPQYRGVLKIVSTYGHNVKKVYPEWIVRENDPFKYQIFKGTEVVPPEWEPHGYDGKIVRVVVPIEYKDGFIDYRVAERESVAVNIKAQIKQSLMNSKDPNKETILAKIQDMTLDELLSDPMIKPLVNETYTGISKEEMLITKLVLNAVKRVQIDYSSALARELHEKTFDNADVYKPNHTAEQVLAMTQQPEVQEIEVDQDGVVVENQEQKAAIEKAEQLAKEEKFDSDEAYRRLFDSEEDND